jgi:hypothetical protein
MTAITDDAATAGQHRLMFRLWNQVGISDRDTRLWITSLWLGRNIESSRTLTRHDASTLIDLLLTADCPSADDADETAYDPNDLF